MGRGQLRSTPLARLALLGLASCAVAAAQDVTIQALDDCVARIERQRGEPAPGLDKIEKQCPELKSILEHSSVAAWLPEVWWGPLLTTDSLLELRELAALESAPREPRALDTSGVAAALASLGKDVEHSQVSWWDRLREWLRSRLQTDSEEPPGWLFKWVDALARHPTALRIIGYCLFGLIVLSAALIVLNELKAAGVLGARGKRQSQSVGLLAPVSSAHGLTLVDIERSDPVNRPSMLLTLLIAALARREDRAADASFTHRELATRVRLDDDSQRSAFAQLVHCAERVRYAGTLPTPPEIDAAVGGGRRLLEAIATATPGTATA